MTHQKISILISLLGGENDVINFRKKSTDESKVNSLNAFYNEIQIFNLSFLKIILKIMCKFEISHISKPKSHMIIYICGQQKNTYENT